MNIKQYNQSMDEISVSKFSLEALLYKRNKKMRYQKMMKVTFTSILIGFLVIYHAFPRQSSSFTITVYAAEIEIPLTNNFVNINADVKPLISGTDNGKDGFVNSNIYFICEGKDIKSITYICSENNAERSNWRTSPASYVENMIVSKDEYRTLVKDDDFMFGWFSPEDEIANVTRMIGPSYTVNYEDQSNKQYGLILKTTADSTGQLKISDTIIKVEVHFNDGSIVYKKLLIKSSDDVSSEMQLRIL